MNQDAGDELPQQTSLVDRMRNIMWGHLSDDQVLDRYHGTTPGTDGALALKEELERRGVAVTPNKNTWLSDLLRRLIGLTRK